MDMLALPSQMTLNEASAALKVLLPAISAEPGPQVQLDASTLTHIDTATLAVLLACRRRAGALQRSFSVQHAPARLVQLAKLYGVQDLLELQSA